MAFGLKYTTTFYQLKNYQKNVPSTANPHQWRIEIYKEGFAGSSTALNCDKDSIVLGRDGDLLDVVQGTKLSFSLINISEGSLKEFRTADWGDYKVILIKDPYGNPQTKFVGYNQSEIYTESYSQPPYSATFEATCGLNHLKHVKWDDKANILEETGKDANSTATVSASVALTTSTQHIRFKVDENTGTYDNVLFRLQTSNDDITFSDSSFSYSGINFTVDTTYLTTNYVRLKVETAEGSASTVDWSIEPLYVSQKSIIEVLRLALNKLPSPIAIREFVNIYEDSINATTTDSMLNQIFVDSSVYKKKSEEGAEGQEEAFSCHRTIEEVLKVFGVNIFQANGIWYIIRVQEYMDSTMYYRDFNANVGTERTITVDGTGNFTSNDKTTTGPTGADGELILVAPSSELSIEPPLNRVQVTYSQENLEQVSSDLVKDGSFANHVAPLSPLNWNMLNVPTASPYPLYYDSNNNGFEKWMFRFDPNGSCNDSFLSGTTYIEQLKPSVATSTLDSVVLSFQTYFDVNFSGVSSGTVVADWINNSLKLTYELEIQFGTYYLNGNDIGGYTWQNSYARATFRYYGGVASNNGSGAGFYNYGTTFWKQTNVTLPTLPETSFVDFRIRLYQPYSNVQPFADSDSDITNDGVSISTSGISLVYLPLEGPPTEELILYSNINEDENIEEIEVLHGDGTNSGTLNSFRTSNYLITNEWTRRSLTDDTDILTLFLKQLGDLKGDFVKELSCTVIGELDVYNTIKETTDVLTHYYIKTYEWNICTSEYSFTLSELENSLLPVVIIKEGVIGDVNPEPVDDTYSPFERITSPTSDGSIVTSSASINPEQTDLNNYI